MTKQGRYKHKNRLEMIKRKSEPCSDCRQKFPHYVMEWDHVPERGEKKFTLSSHMFSQCFESPGIKAEFAKCDLVCANCHAIRTWARNQKLGEYKHSEEAKRKIGVANSEHARKRSTETQN